MPPEADRWIVEVSGLTFVDLDLDETQLGGSIVWTEPEDTTQVRGGLRVVVGWGGVMKRLVFQPTTVHLMCDDGLW